MAETFPLQFLLLTFSGWVKRQQQHVLEYLVEENSVLWEQMKGRALRLTDDQRRRLAAKGKRIGRRLLMQALGPSSVSSSRKTAEFRTRRIAFRIDSIAFQPRSRS